jgi:hypothetical protein
MAAEGISPWRSLVHYRENLSDAWSGKPVINSDLRNTLAATGMSLPQSLASGSGILVDINTTKEWLGRGTTSLGKVGPLKTGIAGAVLGGTSGALVPTDTTLSPADQQAHQTRNALVGAATTGTFGASLPWLSKHLLIRLAAGMEATVRQDAFQQGFMRSVAGLTDNLKALVNGALDEQYKVATDMTTFSGGRVVGTSKLPSLAQQQTADQIGQQMQDFIEGRGGLVSPEWVQSTLTQGGVRPDLSARVGQQWRSALESASQTGQQLAARIHVDYEKLNNVEDFMKWASPFSTWALKMTPFWAEHIMERPAFLLTLADIENEWEQERQKQGLPSRFVGSVEVGPASAIASAILGRPIRMFLNPISGFLPYAGSPRLVSSASQEQNPLVMAYKVISGFGPAPHPVADWLFRVFGALGNEEQPRGYIRQGDTLEAFTGVNPNRVVDTVERSIRSAVSGRDVTDFENQGIQKRVEELAVQQLGHPPNQQDTASIPYIQAINQQKGPIWEQARQDVMKERGLRAATGFAAQIIQPQATLSPEEAAIREAQKVPKQGGSRVEFDPQMTKRLQYETANGNSQGKADAEVAATIWGDAVRVFGPDMPAPLPLYFQMGTWGAINEARKIVSTVQDAGIVKNLQGTGFDVNPLRQGYSGGGSAEEDRLNALLATYNSPGSILTNLSPVQQAAISQAYKTYAYAPAAFSSKMIQDKSISGAALQAAISARDQFRQQNPMLNEYLSYLANTNGQGNTTDFFQRIYRR